jgi:hypothetical protein
MEKQTKPAKKFSISKGPSKIHQKKRDIKE